MSGLDNWPHIPETSSVYDSTPEQLRAAALIVADRARSVDDCRLLLDKLGFTTTSTTPEGDA